MSFFDDMFLSTPILTKSTSILTSCDIIELKSRPGNKFLIYQL